MTWLHTKKTENRRVSDVWRNDGTQDLFVNWKAWPSSVHQGVHCRVFEMPVGERGREKSHDQEQEGQRQKEAGLGDERG